MGSSTFESNSAFPIVLLGGKCSAAAQLLATETSGRPGAYILAEQMSVKLSNLVTLLSGTVYKKLY